MRIEKALINDKLNVSKLSWKLRIPTIYNFAVIYPWNFLFSQNVAYFLTLLSFLFINKTLRLNNVKKTKTAMNAKMFFICVESIIYLLLYNLHDCTFKQYQNQAKNRVGYAIISK